MNIPQRFRLERLPDDEALRAGLRGFLRQELASVPHDRRARSWLGFDAEFSRKLAARKWVGVALPQAYGGSGQDPYVRFIISEELLAVGAPVAAHWIAERQSGPLILKYGSEAQRRFFLPRICAAQAFFCIGMSEPNAGSDLASVRTRASRISGGWVLNGRKIWATNGHKCHYMIALVRTSGSAEDRHQGLSQVIVDMSAPGVTVRPIRDLTGDEHFCEVLFEDVELEEGALVGSEGAGWEQVTSELAFERSGPERIHSSMVLLDLWGRALRQGPCNERQLVAIGRLVTHFAALRSMSVAVASRLARGESPMVEASVVKDLGTEFEQEIPTVIEGLMDAGTATGEMLRTLAYLSTMSPAFSLRGGTREILRGVIARGLGLR